MISGGAWYCQLFAIDVKGGGKATKGFYKTIRGRVLPSMPKGEIVGNIVIDGKDVAKELASKCSREEQRKNASTV